MRQEEQIKANVRSGSNSTSSTAMQYLAYQPVLPTVNKYLQQKWDKASYEMHLQKVKSAKPTIDTTAPKTYGHLALKKKKKTLEEDSMSKIQRENNMLLEKISQIQRTTGYVDNRNEYESKSLCRGMQQQEWLRINKENQLILLRLTQCQSCYSVNDWHDNWLKTVKLMENITRYPQRVTDKKGQFQASKPRSKTETEEEVSLDAEHSTNSSLTPKCKEEGKEEVDQLEEVAVTLEYPNTPVRDPTPATESPQKPDPPQTPDTLSTSSRPDSTVKD
ncbi:hypothetical protein UPYG_G00318560 [Umbra pygmaea]|uniref:Uncharacterized protein n=1 Tax=Umbra pygmaea TaxID=75934 RepID=A0ABD0WHE6_UMBPY